MHPIERLRFIARAGDAQTPMLVRAAASALEATASDPKELLMACRRLIERRPSSGPLIWLCARMITATEPRLEARRATESIENDTTLSTLAEAIAVDATVIAIGYGELCRFALQARDDLSVIVVDSATQATRSSLPSRTTRKQMPDASVRVSAKQANAALRDADLLLIQTHAIGDVAALCPAGSHAAAAEARRRDVPVWLVAGVGRYLHRSLWEPMCEALTTGDSPEPHRPKSPDQPEPDQPESSEQAPEVLPLTVVDQVAGPSGPAPVSQARWRVHCPAAPELFGRYTNRARACCPAFGSPSRDSAQGLAMP